MIEKLLEAKEFKIKQLRNDSYHLDIQSFADGDPVDPPTDPVDPPSDPIDPPTDPIDPPEDPDNGKSKSKTFTQDDVNAIAAKEAKKAQEKLLKQLGVKDVKSAKDGLDQFKKHMDSQKSDADKALEKAQLLEATNTELLTKAQTLEAQNAALKADVNPDSLDDVIVLAKNLVTEDVTIDDAIKTVLEKYPNFKREAKPADEGDSKKKPKFSNGDHKQGDKTTENDAWMNAFNFGGTKQ